jgi:ABC-2 type transport system permease protein
MTATLAWFARHEMRLAWRDLVAMLTAGRRAREWMAAVGMIVFVAVMHGIAWLVVRNVPAPGLHPDPGTLIAVTCAMCLSGSAMLSQAMENVTRAFYTRSDLELILSSPAPVQRLFAVRIGGTALSTGAMSLLIAGPFIDVLALRDGWFWLGAYGAIGAVALLATALAVLFTLALFRAIGPRRTRFAAQVAAALIGAGFVIGIQITAMFSTGSLSRTAFLRSTFVAAHAPGLYSAFWWPARAALGDGFCLAVFVAAGIVFFLLVTLSAAPRFADYALAAGSLSLPNVTLTLSPSKGLNLPKARLSLSKTALSLSLSKATTQGAALRRKERLLLLRDPWLMSQSLMQLFYLLPPALLLSRNFGFGDHVSQICVPVLIMAAGQLAGGLAWLTISGEDAPDLVASAPLTASRTLRAKTEAVIGAIAFVFAPFVVALAFASLAHAVIAAAGIAASAAAATAIQLWFRTHAKRSHFRRRQTSSRIATFAEAFSSITWAAAGAIAAAASPFAAVMAFIAIMILVVVHRLAPAVERKQAIVPEVQKLVRSAYS